MDALTHALEATTGRAANPASDALATTGLYRWRFASRLARRVRRHLRWGRSEGFSRLVEEDELNPITRVILLQVRNDLDAGEGRLGADRDRETEPGRIASGGRARQEHLV